MLLASWAQYKVKSSFANGQQVPASCGLSGLEVAKRILEVNRITNVGIEQVQGKLRDHYDPKAKMLRLSSDVYHGKDLAALGVAAHEVGHAIQDATNYAPLRLRNGIVPLASFGSQFSVTSMMLGGAMQMSGLVLLGVLLFCLTVAFQVVNLPVEFDASSRARKILLKQGIVTTSEDKTVGKVLNAAALTYVAATVSSIGTMLYYLARFSSRRRLSLIHI